MDHTKRPGMKSAAEIVLVISNKAGVKGLDRAQAASINTKVLAQHKGTQASLQTAGTHTKVPRFYRKLQALTQHKGTPVSYTHLTLPTSSYV